MRGSLCPAGCPAATNGANTRLTAKATPINRMDTAVKEWRRCGNSLRLGAPLDSHRNQVIEPRIFLQPGLKSGSYSESSTEKGQGHVRPAVVAEDVRHR